jgi:hypothetical protein
MLDDILFTVSLQVKLKLLLKGTHKSTRCASGELKQKNELFKELIRLSHNVQGTTSHCDIRLIGDVVFWLALTGYRLSLTPSWCSAQKKRRKKEKKNLRSAKRVA